MTQSVPGATSAARVDSPRPTSVRWHIVGLLVMFSFMTWFNRVSMSVAYDEQIKEQSGIPAESIGYVYSSFLFFYMVFMTPGGWLIDRFGAWLALAIMGVGSACFGAMTGAAGLGGAEVLLPALLIIRSLMGILTAPVYPACGRIVSCWMPLSQRALANGLVQGAAAVGIACTFPVFGALIDVVGWRVAFGISGAVTLLVALAWIGYATKHPAEHRFVNAVEKQWLMQEQMYAGDSAAPPEAWWAVLADRSLIFLTLAYAAVGYVEYLFFFWMHYYFEDVLKLGKGESRFYAAVLTLAMAVGMVMGGWAHDRVRQRLRSPRGGAIVPALGLCAGGLLLIAGILAQETLWIVCWLALALAAVGATEAPTWTMAVALGRRQGGTAAAICNTGGNAGGLLAPVLTPLVSGWISRHFELNERAGWQWAIGLGSAIAIVGASLWYWVTPNDGGEPAG